jgi:hypothetical protein
MYGISAMQGMLDDAIWTDDKINVAVFRDNCESAALGRRIYRGTPYRTTAPKARISAKDRREPLPDDGEAERNFN